MMTMSMPPPALPNGKYSNGYTNGSTNGYSNGYGNGYANGNRSADFRVAPDLNILIMCPDCKEDPPNLVDEYSSGDQVCGSCGLVLGERIVDTRSEWRTFANDDQANDDPSRVGDAANPLLNGSQLETIIGPQDGSRARDLARAQNKSTADKSTKSLLNAYKDIGNYCDLIRIPKLASDTAKQLYKTVDDAKAFKGKSNEAVIAGVIFIACRQTGMPRTFREIFTLTQVPKKEVGRVFKLLEKFFQTQGQAQMDAILKQGMALRESDGYKTTTSTKAGDLILRYCNNLRMSNAATSIAQQLAEKSAQLGTLAGRSPISSAAACIYMVSHLLREGKSAKDISVIAGVSDGTVRTAYKLLLNEKDNLIDPSWIKNGKGDMALLPQS